MKAIQEMIDYLFDRDLLSENDLWRLETQGLLEGTSAANAVSDRRDRKSDDFDSPGIEPAQTPADRAQADFDRLPPRRRRWSGARTTANLIATEVVSDRLLGVFVDCAERLDGLRILASPIGPAADLSAALKTLVAASAADLEQAVARIVTRKGPAFLAVWEAATLREHHSVLKPGEHGPAAVACRAVLKGATPSDLGRYVGELATSGFAELMRLVGVQRRILDAMGSLLATAPAVFDRPLFIHRRDETCYWALTIAITALLPHTPAAVAIPLELPRYSSATPDIELRAFEHALAMSRRAFDMLVQPSDDWWSRLRCPPAWNIHFDAR